MYGKRIRNMGDGYIVLSQQAVEGISAVRVPGRFMVEYFPWLRHIPSWMPIFNARKVGNHYRPIVAATRNESYDRVEREIVRCFPALQPFSTHAAIRVKAPLAHRLRRP